jgi:hypothetical protein
MVGFLFRPLTAARPLLSIRMHLAGPRGWVAVRLRTVLKTAFFVNTLARSYAHKPLL